MRRSAAPAHAPLAGTKVLDLSRVLAGPMVGRLLSDLGAEVVKLEPPSEDIARYVAPKRDRGMSGLYTMANVGKRNLCVDLRCEAGLEIALGLVRWADALIENFRPGVMDSLGLGWERLHAENPRLVMLSINGFGAKSQARDRPAYAPTIHAVTGILQYHSEWTGHPLTQLADNQADMISSLHGTIGLLAALQRARATGEGQHVEVPLFEALLATYSETPFVLLDEPEHRDECPLFDAGAIGHVAIAGSLQNAWHKLSPKIEDPAPGALPIPEKRRLRHAAIERWMATHASLEALLASLEALGLAAGRVEALREVLQGPLARERDLVQEVDDRRGGRRPVVRAPYRMNGQTCDIRGPAPRRGEHNGGVLREILGYDDATIAALHEDGVLEKE